MKEIIANTGIQFIEIPLNLEKDEKILSKSREFAEEIIYDSEGREESGTLLFPYKCEEEDIFIDKDSINAEAIDKNGEVIPREIKYNFVKQINPDEIYKVRAREALDIYAGHWLPIPYFRVRNDSNNPFHTGPQNWCRMWIDEVDKDVKENSDCTHKLILAFDTSLENNYQANYYKPLPEDATNSGNERFKCVTKERFFNDFYSREDIYQWLTNIYDLKNGSSKKSGFFRNIANYFVLLDLIDSVNGFPEIGLLNGEAKCIDTALVLDIGNARTCGLIVETSSPSNNNHFDFTNAKKLQLRDLTIPYKVYEEPFEMQIAFAEEKFGNEAVDLMGDAFFNWPSLVRIGPEAIRLTSIFESEDSLATMSSPKRYLWDNESSNLNWIKVEKEGSKSKLRKSALYGIAEYFSSDGKSLIDNKKISAMPATESKFSRASLMTFAIFEIVSQALVQINSAEFRKNMGNSTFKRELKNVVITCPTAMTKKEQTVLRNSVNDAVKIAKEYFGKNIISVDFQLHPNDKWNTNDDDEKKWSYDEATCSQVAYLYGELVEKFKGNHNLFFKYKGKKRSNTNYPNNESVTVASIDIGGGTTDLMICNYESDPSYRIPSIIPNPIFWEGFNIAGDDIVKRIIEFIVLPGIQAHLKSINAQNIEEAMNFMFGPNVGEQAATHRIYRRQFATQIATYCAYSALDHIANESALSKKISIKQVFEKYPRPKNNLIPYIEKNISNFCRINDFKFEDILLEFNPANIEYAISDIIEPIIKQLTKLVSIFDCDILLLSGKSSSIPIINRLFKNAMVLSTDRIVCLSNYRFGNWYPFANALGYVKDAKTTVSVGALVCFLSSLNRLPYFRIDISPLNKINSTANYIGVLENNAIKSKQIIFENNSIEGKFKFEGAPISIGMRQLQSENWIATPLYVFDFSSSEFRERMVKDGYKYPFTITLCRDEEDKETLLEDELVIMDSSGEEVDAAGYFKFKFKTMINEQGYWRDTGSFLINIIPSDND